MRDFFAARPRRRGRLPQRHSIAPAFNLFVSKGIASIAQFNSMRSPDNIEKNYMTVIKRTMFNKPSSLLTDKMITDGRPRSRQIRALKTIGSPRSDGFFFLRDAPRVCRKSAGAALQPAVAPIRFASSVSYSATSAGFADV
jgi:hypothetical protein